VLNYSTIRNDSDESPEDLGPESEEEDEEVNPYPLEGKYKDEDERERCVTPVHVRVACLIQEIVSWICPKLSVKRSWLADLKRCSAFKTSVTSTPCCAPRDMAERT
jgi:hypothetical protein